MSASPASAASMQVVHTIADCRALRSGLGRDLAFVPTMGALHAGHRSLMRHAKRLAPVTAVSIFVNPTQFGRNEDFGKYPRTLEADLKMCEEEGVSLVFVPEAAEVYRPNLLPVIVDLPTLTDTLEGKHRPGHFRGVCQVVAKLFNIVQPSHACFGMKDFQQLRVIQAMVDALDFPLDVVPCPTVREPDGLAMSSRNRYLSPDERQRALAISKALRLCKEAYDAGQRQTNRFTAIMQNTLLDVGQLGHVPVSIEYTACVDPHTFRPIDVATGPALCAIAARVGSTRLIDNVLLGA